MSSVFNDTVFDFDLNLLHQSKPSNNAQTSLHHKYEKQKRQLVTLKKKIVATDTLIGKYYAKRDALDDAEKTIVSLKEQSKQLRIEYNNSLEQKGELESKLQLLQDEYKKLEESCFTFKTQYEAQTAYAHQLKILLTEKDTKIESLRIEKKLDSGVAKDNSKKQSVLAKANETLLKDITLFANFVKKYLAQKKFKPKYETLLRKYTSNDGNASDWTEDSDIEDDIFEECVLSPGDVKTNDKDKKSSCEEMDDDNHEFASLDTGRGSSLALDNLQSPGYFSNDSPSTEENMELRPKRVDVGTTTDPVVFTNTVERAISPIKFGDAVEMATSPVRTSVRVDIGTSPIQFKDKYKELSKGMSSKNKNIKATQEKACLELNSSDNLQCGGENDDEIREILNNMKLDFKPLSPIPRTPSITRAMLGNVANKRINLKNCEELCEYLALQLLIAKGWETNGANVAPPDLDYAQRERRNSPRKSLFASNLPIIEEEEVDSIVNNVPIGSKPTQKPNELFVTPKRKRKREEKDSTPKSAESPKKKAHNKNAKETFSYQTPKKQLKNHANKFDKKSESKQRSRLFSIDDTVKTPKGTSNEPLGNPYSKQFNSSSEESVTGANSVMTGEINLFDTTLSLKPRQNSAASSITKPKCVQSIKECVVKLTKTPIKEGTNSATTPRLFNSQKEKEVISTNDQTSRKQSKIKVNKTRRSRLFSTEDMPEITNATDLPSEVVTTPSVEVPMTLEEQIVSSEEPIVIVVAEEESDPVTDSVLTQKSVESFIIPRRKSNSIGHDNDTIDNNTISNKSDNIPTRVLRSRLFSTEEAIEPISFADPLNVVTDASLDEKPNTPSEEPLFVVVTEEKEFDPVVINNIKLSPNSTQNPTEPSITTRSKSRGLEQDNNSIVKTKETSNASNKSTIISTRVLRSRLFSTEVVTEPIKAIDTANETPNIMKEQNPTSEESEVYTNIKIIIEEEEVTLSPKTAEITEPTIITRRKSKTFEQDDDCTVKTTEQSDMANKSATNPTRVLRSQLFSIEDATQPTKATNLTNDPELYTNLKITIEEELDSVTSNVKSSPKSAKSPKSSIITRRRSRSIEKEKECTIKPKESAKLCSPKLTEAPGNNEENEVYSYPIPRKTRISHYNTLKNDTVIKRTPQKIREISSKNKIKKLRARPNVTTVAQPKNRKLKLNSSLENLVVDTNSVMTDEEEYDPIINTLSPKPVQTCTKPLIITETNVEPVKECIVKLTKVPNVTSPVKLCKIQDNKENDEKLNDSTQRKRRKTNISESETVPKRTLRSSLQTGTEDMIKSVKASNDSGKSPSAKNIESVDMPLDTPLENENPEPDRRDSNGISYNDLAMFSTEEPTEMRFSPPAFHSIPKESTASVTSSTCHSKDRIIMSLNNNNRKENTTPSSSDNCNPKENTTSSRLNTCHPKESILCRMIEKFGVTNVKAYNKMLPEHKVRSICEKLEHDIKEIVELPPLDTKPAMDKLVAELQKLDYKFFTAGLIKYLSNKERKNELYGKIFSPPAPPMTKPEQVLLYIITRLKGLWLSVDIVDAVLSNIEYTLFKLSRTPEFEIIECMAHFYAILCRYFRAKSRLRLFLLDAMYCIQYKSVALIKQCLEVWMHVIPLAHMGIAKTPLVTCMMYLLHFYKCEDKYQRVQEIRNILNRKYNYQITDWNEKRILDLFETSIRDLKDIQIEKKMLRLALIILAKRNGAQWCQNNIIKKIIMPMIEREKTPHHVKEFCIRIIGPLMKPYPVDMKIHCEIVMNQLTDILQNEPSQQIEEAIITSMMFINRHEQIRIDQLLLTRKMKPMSSELEGIIRDYVRSKPLKSWKKNLEKMARRSD